MDSSGPTEIWILCNEGDRYPIAIRFFSKNEKSWRHNSEQTSDDM